MIGRFATGSSGWYMSLWKYSTMSFTISGSSSPLVGSSPVGRVTLPSSPSYAVVSFQHDTHGSRADWVTLNVPSLKAFLKYSDCALTIALCTRKVYGSHAIVQSLNSPVSRTLELGSVYLNATYSEASPYHASPALWALYGLAMALVGSTWSWWTSSHVGKQKRRENSRFLDLRRVQTEHLACMQVSVSNLPLAGR